jgi:hypothetical protein
MAMSVWMDNDNGKLTYYASMASDLVHGSSLEEVLTFLLVKHEWLEISPVH